MILSAHRASTTERFLAVYGIGFGVLLTLLGPLGPGLLVVGANLLVAAVVLTFLPRLRAARNNGIASLGQMLPLLGFYLFYRECAVVLNQPGVPWHDLLVQTADRALVGPGPHSAAAMGEWFAFGYMSYVPVLILAGLIQARRAGSPAGVEDVVQPICIAWGACYVVFVLFPVLGPRLADPAFQVGRIGAGPFTSLAVANQQYGMLWGAAFPSAHIAATVIALFIIRRSLLFWLLLPIGLSIPVAAFYLGYHYLTDIIAGVVMAIAVLAFQHWSHASQVTTDPGASW